ncbi:MAG: polysaccharide deacetylase family protein [Putridiphycobacter sp.]
MKIFKIPKWLTRFYPYAIWDFFYQDKNQKTVYLTFDDGPTPEVSEWVLECLARYKAKATFFCIGNNVRQYPEIYKQYLAGGHQVGNHGMHHIKGTKVSLKNYLADVLEGAEYIQTKLFRPPYGKIKLKQIKRLKAKGFKTVLWSLITYDFDRSVSSEKRLKKIKQHVKSGSIIVFHDSLKAFPQLKNDLPLVLEYLQEKGYQFKTIPE